MLTLLKKILKIVNEFDHRILDDQIQFILIGISNARKIPELS